MSKQTTEKKEFNMKQVFAMCLKKSKAGKQYLSGYDDIGRLVGFFNGKKKNPKEPDVRIYRVSEDGGENKEYTALWVNVSKNGKKFLTGKIDDVKVVGFINASATPEGKRPYFSVYESEATPQKKADADGFMPVDTKEELPF